MDTFGTSWTGKDYSFTHNDAIEGAIVSLGCTIFFAEVIICRCEVDFIDSSRRMPEVLSIRIKFGKEF